MKTKPKIKARRLYSFPYEHCYVLSDVAPAKTDRFAQGCVNPVLVFPDDAETYTAMVEQLAEAAFTRHAQTHEESGQPAKTWAKMLPHWRENYGWLPNARADLAVLGIVEPEGRG